MAKQTSLQEQTSDPRWQRKRLEILERDEWTCKQCGDTETTLTVHHKSYRMEGGKFVDYWDYEDQHLATLCNPCHEQEELDLLKIKNELYYQVRELCEDAFSMTGVVKLLAEIQERKQGRVAWEDFGEISKLTEEMFKGGTKSFFADMMKILGDDDE